jgi:LacI family transcriptional regulator
LSAVECSGQKGLGNVSIRAVASRSDKETVELIRTIGPESDAFGLLGKNTAPVKAALLDLRRLGIPVMALVSDLDATTRSTYIGADNRAAGQLAGFVLGRSLERESDATVVLIQGNLSYRCWEDREIGFRSLLRRRFPQIKILEIVAETGLSHGTYEAALSGLGNECAIGGIYNVAGENESLAQATYDIQLPYRPLYITHELDEATEPLLRAGVIDFLITENLKSIVNLAKRFLIGLRASVAQYAEVNFVPVELISRFNLPLRTTL